MRREPWEADPEAWKPAGYEERESWRPPEPELLGESPVRSMGLAAEQMRELVLAFHRVIRQAQHMGATLQEVRRRMDTFAVDELLDELREERDGRG